MNNISLLLVEDDEDKRDQLVDFLKNNNVSVFDEARSFQSALKAIKAKTYDLVILDMTMPTFNISRKESGGRSQSFGGELLLHEMVRRTIKTKVVVVTQFDLFGKGEDEIKLKDLDAKLSSQFSTNYLGIVHYNTTYTGWQNLLLKIISNAGIKL